MPTWLSNKEIVIIKTFNGWAVGSDKGADARDCVAFETWDALVYWLNAHWVAPARKSELEATGNGRTSKGAAQDWRSPEGRA